MKQLKKYDQISFHGHISDGVTSEVDKGGGKGGSIPPRC